MVGPEHFVQFYSSDTYIIDAVSGYLIHGLRYGETCFVAATREHLDEIERIAARFDDSFETARSEGRYIALEAHETLSRIMAGDQPSAKLFDSIIGKPLSRAAKRGNIRVFGELVAILCAQNNFEGAVKLEGLWNRLRQKHPFSLFCAYPVSALIKAGKNMEHICGTHDRVIPDESYTSISPPGDRTRAIALLQQKARQLESDLAELEARIAARQAAPSPVLTG